MKEGLIRPDKKADYPFSSMRDYLAWLEENEFLLTIEDELSNKYETSAVGREMFVKGGSGYGPTSKALLFTNIKDYSGVKTCCMLLGHINFISKILGTTKEHLYKVYPERVSKLKKMKMVSDGKFAENKYEGVEVDVEKTIPIEVSSEKQGGPYLTMWPSTFLDPEMGSFALGIYRHMIQGKDVSSMLLLPGQRSQEAYNAYKKRGQNMPITLFNGGPQVTMLASQLKAPRNITKMDLAGALHEESIECVKTDVNGLPVPSTSEFVMDAEMSTTELVDEGPFGTWTDYYDYVRKMPKMLIKAIYHRDDPIYQIAAFPPEGKFTAEVMTGLSMTQIYKSFAPEVEAVRVLSSWGGVTLIVLDKERRRKGSPMRVGSLAASVQPALKMCIITDNDYDYWNMDQILWTICMKWAPTKDTQIIGPLPGFLVPTEKYETGEDLLKYAMIIDATEPPAPYNEIYKRGIVDVPEETKKKAKEILRKYESV